MISVIVPVYKAEKFLDRCVSSILNQTYKNLELILVDDGSPDKSPEMCDGFAKKDSRVKVIHKKNGGVSTARNAGLEVAAGDYIAFVDSDDWIEPDMYQKMMAAAESYDCDVVMCDCVKDFPDHSEVYTHDIRSGFYDAAQLKKEYYPHLLIMENVEYPATISNWTLLWRSTLNTSNQRYQAGVRYSEDLLFGAKLLRNASSFCYLKGEAYYHYVMNPSSATHTFVPDKWRDYSLLHSCIKAEFGSVQDYDFSGQIDRCLLFFLYNTVGEILGLRQLTNKDKLNHISSILKENNIRDMFKRLDIMALPISYKQKVITWLYKKQWAISLLCKYYERK